MPTLAVAPARWEGGLAREHSRALACAPWTTASATCCCNSHPRRGTSLRRVLIRGQVDRDEIAQQLRYGDANGDGWADVIDTLTMSGSGWSRRIFQWVESASIARLRGRGLYFSFLDTPAVSSRRFLQAEAARSSYGGQSAPGSAK